MKTEVIYEFRLENDDLGVCEEVVIKDDNPIRAISDATIIFNNRLLESDEVITNKNFYYYLVNKIMSVYNNEGWLLRIENYDDYPSDLIDVDNCL